MRRHATSFLLCALLWAACGFSGVEPGQVRSLTILHLNDLHARLLPLPGNRGGFAHVATAIQVHKADAPGQTLVLHGGDFVQGSPVSTIFEGLPVFEVANFMDFDANVLGNHEFDYGWRKIPEFLEASDFPNLAANLVNDEGELLAPPYVIREINGIRVGLIGILTERLDDLTRSPLRGPWNTLPVVETARRYAREIDDEADLIVVLSHIFNEEEDLILRNAPEVDLIVSGHNHGGQEEVKQAAGRLCVKVRAYGLELGRLDLEVDVPAGRIVSHKWARIPIHTNEFPADPVVQKQVDLWEAKVAEVVDVPIGRSRREISRHGLQPLIEGIMAEAVRADLAYMNRGGIRDSLPEGPLTARHAWNILPFGNTIVSGRVEGVKVPEEAARGRTLHPDREYLIATNSFIAEKWRERGLDLPQQGPVLRDVFIEWIKERREVP